jgi:hypothetical protein
VFAGVSEPIWSIHTKSSEWGHEMTINRFTRSGIALPASGKILQVVSTSTTSAVNVSSSSYSDLFSLAITPSSVTSKILILASINGQADAANGTPSIFGTYKVLRDTTEIISAARLGLWDTNLSWGSAYSSVSIVASVFHLDSPSTTSSITYKVQGNRTTGAGTLGYNSIAGSYITLFEVGA